MSRCFPMTFLQQTKAARTVGLIVVSVFLAYAPLSIITILRYIYGMWWLNCGMWWLNGSAPDCKTCSPGFESGISPTCRDMSFLVGESARLA